MGRPNLGKVRVQVKLSPATLALLAKEMKRRRMDRSAIIELLIRQTIGGK